MYCRAQLLRSIALNTKQKSAKYGTSLTHVYHTMRFIRSRERGRVIGTYPLDRTKRSRLNHFELFGLALKNLDRREHASPYW